MLEFHVYIALLCYEKSFKQASIFLKITSSRSHVAMWQSVSVQRFLPREEVSAMRYGVPLLIGKLKVASVILSYIPHLPLSLVHACEEG